MIGRRILILVPHPDDEVVGAAAAIGRAQAAGAEVFVLYLSDGIPAEDLLWPWQRADRPDRARRRWMEAALAATALGIGNAGQADRPTRTLRRHLDIARTEIIAALDRLSPDRLWVPAYEGGHQDHDAANFLAATLSRRVEVWEFAEYNFAGGTVRRNSFPVCDGTELVCHLTDAERATKQALLALYRSERGNLAHIGAASECFRKLHNYDYAIAPHPGRQFYQRFQWVPFHHPTIDRTTPDQVCADLRAYSARLAD